MTIIYNLSTNKMAAFIMLLTSNMIAETILIIYKIIFLKYEKKKTTTLFPEILLLISIFTIIFLAIYRKFPIIQTKILKTAQLFIITILILFRTIYHIYHYNKKFEETLSAFSLKEAIDSINYGLLLYSTDINTSGQIYLCNNKMYTLMNILIGEMIFDGKKFYQMLLNGEILNSCKKSELEKLPVFTLPNGKIWQFEKHILQTEEDFILISASDITEYRKTTYKLHQKNRELNSYNKKLKEMLENLEYICKQEEIIRMKSGIHDLLGHRISIMLRNLREHKIPSEESLLKFSKSLTKELKNASYHSQYNLEPLIKDFEKLGIKIHTEGTFPENERIKKLFFEIVLESISNAIRHGYATEIFIKIKNDNENIKLLISDNGIVKSQPIIEGEGFKNMRRKASNAGGKFKYRTNPDFLISVTIKKGA